MFANRYPAKQWRMEMAPGEWAPRLHPVLIVAGQAAGNLSWGAPPMAPGRGGRKGGGLAIRGVGSWYNPPPIE